MDDVKKVDASIVLKSGFWYTVCVFLQKSLHFITVPLFSRIMTKTDIGYFGNMSSWMSILTVLTSFELSQSIIRSKLEVKDDLDSYIWSILSLTTITTGATYIVFCLFPDFFSGLFNVEARHFHIMFLYLLTAPAFNMFITKQRAFYKYKSFVIITFISSIAATILSVTLVLLLPDKLAGRIYGGYIPHIIIGAAFYILLLQKGKVIKTEHWKYALVLMLPLVPHVLSLSLLSSSDRIIITRVCGEEYTAVYTIAYSCYHIATVLFHSLNKAWAPWLLDNLHIKNYEEIRSVSKKYVGLFVILINMVFFLAPEIIWILGGKSYAEAVYCIPPLIASCVIQLIYTMYVNVEFFAKKTIGVSIGTIIAALANIGLNLLLIPLYPEKGYTIAAYTTLAGYALLFVIHYFLVKRLHYEHVFDIRFLVIVIAITLAIAIGSNILYSHMVVRYSVAAAYAIALVIFTAKNKKMIRSIIKR